MYTQAFKYHDGELMVYTTDSDNEYPCWRKAKDRFYHLKFSLVPLYTAPPKPEWVDLTDEDVLLVKRGFSGTLDVQVAAFARAIEAKLKEKNHG